MHPSQFGADVVGDTGEVLGQCSNQNDSLRRVGSVGKVAAVNHAVRETSPWCPETVTRDETNRTPGASAVVLLAAQHPESRAVGLAQVQLDASEKLGLIV